MYRAHAWVFSPQDPLTPIWRYFKHKRFMDLLDSGHLHCARLDQFSDPFEGVLPNGTISLEKDLFTNAPRNPGDALTDFQLLLRENNLINRICTFANCWYMNTNESEAMWKLFGSDGLAIQSSFARLCASLRNEIEDVHVGKLTYSDYRTEQPLTYGNTLAAAFFKRVEFEHERELRAVVVRCPEEYLKLSVPLEQCRDFQPRGMKINVDLDVLIERVIVSPGQSSQFYEEVEELLKRSGLSKHVDRSTLDDLPNLI